MAAAIDRLECLGQETSGESVGPFAREPRVSARRYFHFGVGYRANALRIGKLTMDNILEAFLRRQKKKRGLAAASDRLDLPAPGNPPKATSLNFTARADSSGAVYVTLGEEFVVRIDFPSDYLRRADAAQVLTWLTPLEIFHPNIRAPFICVGRLVPGTPLVDILHQVFEIITYNKVTMREDDALNHEACAWARNNKIVFHRHAAAQAAASGIAQRSFCRGHHRRGHSLMRYGHHNWPAAVREALEACAYAVTEVGHNLGNFISATRCRSLRASLMTGCCSKPALHDRNTRNRSGICLQWNSELPGGVKFALSGREPFHANSAEIPLMQRSGLRTTSSSSVHRFRQCMVKHSW